MGLAASQARFLQLTARKSDLEFNGQQVNHQRTIIAYQTEQLFNNLLVKQLPNANLMPVKYDAAGQPTNDSDGDGLSNEYENAKAAYDAEVAVIQADIEKYHIQDRVLELELKNIDSQQQAVQTEVEAVQKIIDKNIDMTFKTFA